MSDHNTLDEGLACAALQPMLRTVLLLNAEAETVWRVAGRLSLMLACTTGQRTEMIAIPANADEDWLWGSTILSDSAGPACADSSGVPWMWRKGALVQENDESLRILVLPDLARVSQTVARAIIAMAEAPVGHVERHGASMTWIPRLCWVAGCSLQDIGLVPRHVLERFTLRLPWPAPDETGARVQTLQAMLRAGTQPAVPEPLPLDLADRLHKGTTVVPVFTREPLQDLLAYPALRVESARRSLALARLARAQAQLAGCLVVGTEHVAAAANLIGLARGEGDGESARPAPDSDEYDSPDIRARRQQMERNQEAPGPALQQDDDWPENHGTSLSGETKEVIEGGSPERFPSTPLGPDPYEEDNAAPLHEPTPLRQAATGQVSALMRHGRAIGAERARNLRDVSVFDTLMEALKYQRVRRKGNTARSNRLLLSPSDLRTYRRQLVPNALLMLVVDYTSVRDRAWQEALLPHLRWAYTERARVILVQVGARFSSDQEELRARVVSADSVITPRLTQALQAIAGRATPLAHGLELAWSELTSSLHRGRGVARQAQLIVVSDGRGNVPLSASKAGRILRPVRREGVDDTLTIARKLHALKYLQTTLLDPCPREHRELPDALADALGAALVEIPFSEDILT